MSTVTRKDNQTGTEITIHYEVIGRGKTSIVFHHGNGNCLEDWYSLGYVAALKNDFQLVLIDSRGYGKSSKPHSSEEYSLKSRADDTIAVLDKEAIDSACCLGASIGASICLLLARFYPQRFSSYIFATPSFKLYSQELKMTLNQGSEVFLKKLEEMIGQRFNNPAVRASILANDTTALWAANSSEWFDYHDFISYVKTPSLIYVGAKESLLQEITEFSKLLDQFSGFKSWLHIFPNMDKAEVYWKGEMVAPIIKDFLGVRPG